MPSGPPDAGPFVSDAQSALYPAVICTYSAPEAEGCGVRRGGWGICACRDSCMSLDEVREGFSWRDRERESFAASSYIGLFVGCFQMQREYLEILGCRIKVCSRCWWRSDRERKASSSSTGRALRSLQMHAHRRHMEEHGHEPLWSLCM